MPPKSTGRDLFNTAWLQQHLQGFASAAPADVQATLTALTAQSCCDALLRFGAGSRRLVLCGGGTLNAELVRRLQQGLPGVRVESSAAHGLPPLVIIGALLLLWELLCARPGAALPAPSRVVAVHIADRL